MIEIECKHENLFEKYLEGGVAYKGGIYDFTFENRYLIYHIDRKTIVSYIAIDMTTDKFSNCMVGERNKFNLGLKCDNQEQKIRY